MTNKIDPTEEPQEELFPCDQCEELFTDDDLWMVEVNTGHHKFVDQYLCRSCRDNPNVNEDDWREDR